MLLNRLARFIHPYGTFDHVVRLLPGDESPGYFHAAPTGQLGYPLEPVADQASQPAPMELDAITVLGGVVYLTRQPLVIHTYRSTAGRRSLLFMSRCLGTLSLSTFMAFLVSATLKTALVFPPLAPVVQ